MEPAASRHRAARAVSAPADCANNKVTVGFSELLDASPAADALNTELHHPWRHHNSERVSQLIAAAAVRKWSLRMEVNAHLVISVATGRSEIDLDKKNSAVQAPGCSILAFGITTSRPGLLTPSFGVATQASRVGTLLFKIATSRRGLGTLKARITTPVLGLAGPVS